MKALFIISLLYCFNLKAASFSELDLMTREALELFYQNENTKIDPLTDVFNLQLIESSDLNVCDFEISALVKYQKNQKKYAEYCQVCFVYLDRHHRSVDYQDVFCF